jgi:hypothetical protein
MARVASDMVPRDARITDRTRSMFRAILAENCIADTDDTILEQEVTCIPASRDAPRNETNHWYFEFN